MRSTTLFALCALLLFLSAAPVLLVDAMIPRRGMYVSLQSTYAGNPLASNILGNTTKEDALFTYCVQHGVNALSLYDVDNGSILPGMSAQLGNFITRARRQAGIRFVESIAGETLSTWQDVATYQAQCTSEDEKFDGMVTEIEYWANGGTNVTQMLAPVVYMKSLNPVPRRNPINASWSVFYYASYIGWPVAGQILRDMDPVLDYLFIHAYRLDPSSAFSYTQARMDELLGGRRMRAVVIYSAEPDFMGPWFASSVNNTIRKAEATYLTDYTAAHPQRYNQTEFGGFQYFTYALLSTYSNYTSNSGPWLLGTTSSASASPNVTATWPLIRAGSAYTSIAWCPTYQGSSTLCQDTQYVKLEHDAVFLDLFDTPASTIAALKYRNWTNGTAVSTLPNRQIICYFSGGTWEDWRPDKTNFSSWTHPNALGEWPGEYWFDITNLTVQETIYPAMQWRMNLAKEKGCDAVQSDNMDCWANAECVGVVAANDGSLGPMQITYNTWMANTAHKAGLAIGLINDLLQVEQLEPLYDFAIQESCMEYSECAYIEPFLASGKAVFHVEYQYNQSQVCANDQTVTLGTYMSSLTAVNGLWVACPDSVLPPTRSLEYAASPPTTAAPVTTTAAANATTSAPPTTNASNVSTTTAAATTTTRAPNATNTTAAPNTTASPTTAAATTTTPPPQTTSTSPATTNASNTTTAPTTPMMTTTAASNNSTNSSSNTTAAPTSTVLNMTTTAAANATTTSAVTSAAPNTTTTDTSTNTNSTTTSTNTTGTTTSTSTTGAPNTTSAASTTVAPPPTPTSSAVPFLRSTLRIPGDGFAQIINSNNASLIAALKLAVRRDLAKLLKILELYIIINSISVGSLVTDFSVTSDANVTATAANATLATLPNTSSWLSNTQMVYSTYTTQGQAGEVLATPTVVVSSVGITTTAAPATTFASVPTTTVAAGTPVTTSLGSGCGTACIAFAVAAGVAGLLVFAVVTGMCCCRGGTSSSSSSKARKAAAAGNTPAPTSTEPVWGAEDPYANPIQQNSRQQRRGTPQQQRRANGGRGQYDNEY